MSCRICGISKDTRLGVCFDCTDFESLISEKLDMYDKPIVKEVDGSQSLNILAAIISYYRDDKSRKKEANTASN